MNTQSFWWKLTIRLTLLAVLVTTVACTGQGDSNGPQAWIDHPRDGAAVPVGTPVSIISHAYARQGVAEVLLSVNGQAYRRDPPSPAGAFGQVEQEWLPDKEGIYTLQVKTYDTSGAASHPDTVTVRVVSEIAQIISPTPTSTPLPPPEITVTPTETTETPTPTPTGTTTPTETPTSTLTPEPPTATFTVEPPTPTFTPTFTPTPPPADIRLWADQDTIQAGSCTTVRWHVSNINAYWVDGKPGAGDDGSFQTCPCQNETHTLRATLKDGSEQNLSLTIHVSGQCQAPADTTSPSVPTPLKPKGDLPCVKDVILRWSAATDKSGIAGYYIKLEMEVKKNQWQSVRGWGPVTGEELKVDVNCGVHYRWQIRARDKAGNTGDWSAPLEFSIALN